MHLQKIPRALRARRQWVLRADGPVGAMCDKMQITTALHTPRVARVCQNTLPSFVGA